MSHSYAARTASRRTRRRRFHIATIWPRARSRRRALQVLLAALAQVEGAGNPVARTYWRWHLTWNPLELYRPASSAVGMYQTTDATFREAKRYCIHNHAVVEDGPWHDVRSCWFNGLYTRVVPSHAVELTSAHLDRGVASTLEHQRITTATLQQKQDLAAVIHLCGAGAGEVYPKRGFRLTANQRCGDHDVRGYLAQRQRLVKVVPWRSDSTSLRRAVVRYPAAWFKIGSQHTHESRHARATIDRQKRRH